MPSADVRWPIPLWRQHPWYPGQLGGVPGVDTETGLRAHSTGAVFYVDPNYPGVSDARDGTNPTNPLATVAQALTLCQAYRGDTIAVMANDSWEHGGHGQGYTLPIQESVEITVPGVRIVGVCPSGGLGVYWQPAAADGICISVFACDVTIEGIAFVGDGGGTGVFAQWAGTNLGDNVVIRHCFFNDDLDEGIILEESWYADIHNNMFDEVQSYGVYNNPATADPAYARIHHNWFHDIPIGAISMEEADRCHVYENYIYNTLAASGNAGTVANCLINFTNGSRNLVHHNTLSCVLPAAVAWDYDATCTAAGNDSWNSNWCMNGPSVTNPT